MSSIGTFTVRPVLYLFQYPGVIGFQKEATMVSVLVVFVKILPTVKSEGGLSLSIIVISTTLSDDTLVKPSSTVAQLLSGPLSL